MEMNDFWRDRRVFLTGATGLLGGSLVQRLLNLGAEVVCLVRDATPHNRLYCENLIEQVSIVNGHVCDFGTVERVLAEYGITTVFHLAAQTIVGVANRDPVSTFEANVRGTWTLLEACRRSPLVEQIVVASSDKAYGEHAQLPYDETMPLQGRHPYDVSKSCVDLLAQTYAVTYSLPVCITRCANLFGGGDFNWNRLIPGTIRSLLRNERPVIRSDGQYFRDYLYVEDATAAYALLAQRLSEEPDLRGEAFNFSMESRLTVLDVVRRILDLMKSDLCPDIRNEASNEIREQYLSSAKARRVLGWAPSFTMDEGLRRTIAWYTQYFAHSQEAQ